MSCFHKIPMDQLGVVTTGYHYSRLLGRYLKVLSSEMDPVEIRLIR
jgi:hypothetical protein